MNPAYVQQMLYKYQVMDWAVIVALLIGCVIMKAAVYPHCRSFEWTDPSINYPMKDDAFPGYSLVLMALLIPLLYVLFSRTCVAPLRRMLGEPLSLLAPGTTEAEGTTISSAASATSPSVALEGGVRPRVVEPVKVRSLKCGTGPVYAWVKAHFWALTLEVFATDFMKLYAGRLRPDFLDRMRKAGFTANSGLPDPHTTPEYYCELMKDHDSLREGRLSFPSGHSGLSFAVFTITTFYFFAHLRPFARQGSLTRLLISLSPLFVPIFCAISRTRDNKHNFSDILAGSCIGVASALFVFACAFRETGGPLSVYLARTEDDVEYVKQLLIAANTSGGLGGTVSFSPQLESRGGLSQRRTGGDYQTAAPLSSPGTEMRAIQSAVGLDDGATVAVPVSSTAAAVTAPSSPLSAAAAFKGGSGGERGRVVLVTTVGERELNEDPAAVPWL